MDTEPRPFPWPIFAALAWVAGWLWLGRWHMLDDALIHLRFAQHLANSTMVSYDGATPSYGASSLLYVGVLAALRFVSTSFMLPKAVSVLVYLGLCAYIVHKVLRERESGLVWAALGVACAGPLAIRWLTDGMETGLMLVAALLVVAWVRSGDRSLRWMVGGALISALAVALRVELVALVAWMAAAAIAERGSGDLRRMSREALSFVPMGAGAAAALVVIWAGMGHILPDTAVAKAVVPRFALVGITSIATTLASAGTFGIGLFAVWVASTVPLVLSVRKGRLAWLPLVIANSIFPALCFVIFARGQIPAARYLVWSLVASIAWNAEALAATRIEPLSSRISLRIGLVLTSALVGLVAVVEAPTAARIMTDRSATLEKLAAAHFDSFQGRAAVAGDIGMFGYFSRTQVCDLSGLVNGRSFARLSAPERATACAALKPEVAFVTDGQLDMLASQIDFARWKRCGSVDFTNAGSPDRHVLMVDPASGLGCPLGY